MSNTLRKRNFDGDRADRVSLLYGSLFRNSMLTMLAVLMVLPSMGCVSQLRLPRFGIGDALLERYRDTVWARRAFNLRYNNCDIPYADHFRSGFIAGYCQQCGGGDGYVPALPPEEYRGIEYQSADGAQCVKAWFDGFPAGVAAAGKDRAGDFHDIYTSKMINSAVTQDKAKHLLPDDVPVLKGGGNSATANASTTGPSYRQARMPSMTPTPVNTMSAPSVPYAAPPEKASNPILKPNALTPDDLVPAPTIRKTGPLAMRPASSTKKITIDPAVSVATPPAPITVARRVAQPLLPMPVEQLTAPVVQGNSDAARVATLPPIVSGSKVKAKATGVVDQTPLPMAVRRPSWATPNIQR